MKRFATGALAFVAGCNQIFGLDGTVLRDGSVTYFDAGPDAASTCADPSVVPTFSGQFDQAVFAEDRCGHYQSSAIGLAIARCAITTGGSELREAHVGNGGDMVKPPGDLESNNVDVYSYALAPEGTEMYVSRFDSVEFQGVWRFERDQTGAWIRKEKTNIPIQPSITTSSVTRGPRRRMFVMVANNKFDEYEQAPDGTWSLVMNYTSAMLGIGLGFWFDLSQDGLRLLINGTDPTGMTGRIRYAYRNTIDEQFGLSVVAPTVPSTGDIFFAEDCDRLYFGGLSSVFFTRRL